MKLIERSSQRLTLQNQNYPHLARTGGQICLGIGVLLVVLLQPVMPSPSVSQQLLYPIYSIAAVLMALGAWAIATDTTTKVSFDRHHSHLQIIWHRFLKDAQYTCNLHEIVDVKLERSVKSYNRPQNIEFYYSLNHEALPQEYVVWRIDLILASGHALPLTQQFNSDARNGEDIKQLFSYIQEFLAGPPCLKAA
jgi:hypothetical protein